MSRIGVQDLRNRVYDVTHAVNGNITKADAGRAVDAALDYIAESLKEKNDVILPGFGSFNVTERKEREGRNPQTGKTMTIAASKSVRFKPGKQLKESVNE